jgi:hypothetical protein
MFVGAFNRNVTPCPADRHHQFDLVMELAGLRGVGHLPDLTVGNRHDGIRRLAEKEGRLARRIKSHLHGMRRIVAPDTVDPAHGEARVASFHRNAYGYFGFKNIGHLE